MWVKIQESKGEKMDSDSILVKRAINLETTISFLLAILNTEVNGNSRQNQNDIVRQCKEFYFIKRCNQEGIVKEDV